MSCFDRPDQRHNERRLRTRVHSYACESPIVALATIVSDIYCAPGSQIPLISTTPTARPKQRLQSIVRYFARHVFMYIDFILWWIGTLGHGRE